MGTVEIDWTGVIDYPDGSETPTAVDKVHRVSPAIDSSSPVLAPSAKATMLVQAAKDDRTAWRGAATTAWRSWYDGLASAQQDALWSGHKRWAGALVTAGFGAP